MHWQCTPGCSAVQTCLIEVVLSADHRSSFQSLAAGCSHLSETPGAIDADSGDSMPHWDDLLHGTVTCSTGFSNYVP